jgi:hypothetical protein
MRTHLSDLAARGALAAVTVSRVGWVRRGWRQRRDDECGRHLGGAVRAILHRRDCAIPAKRDRDDQGREGGPGQSALLVEPAEDITSTQQAVLDQMLKGARPRTACTISTQPDPMPYAIRRRK